jgi:hypothetical protein
MHGGDGLIQLPPVDKLRCESLSPALLPAAIPLARPPAATTQLCKCRHLRLLEDNCFTVSLTPERTAHAQLQTRNSTV